VPSRFDNSPEKSERRVQDGLFLIIIFSLTNIEEKIVKRHEDSSFTLVDFEWTSTQPQYSQLRWMAIMEPSTMAKAATMVFSRSTSTKTSTAANSRLRTPKGISGDAANRRGVTPSNPLVRKNGYSQQATNHFVLKHNQAKKIGLFWQT
jgi:hypothetical protein